MNFTTETVRQDIRFCRLGDYAMLPPEITLRKILNLLLPIGIKPATSCAYCGSQVTDKRCESCGAPAPLHNATVS